MSEVTEFRCICVVGMLYVGTVFNVGKQKRELFVLIDRDRINSEGREENELQPEWWPSVRWVFVTIKMQIRYYFTHYTNISTAYLTHIYIYW